MEVILSVAVSLDGFIDDCSPERLKLSSPEDWASVLHLRAECDAILVGAETVRRDNPSLAINDQALRDLRISQGLDPDITKITITSTGNLDPTSNFFTRGKGPKIVFTKPGTNVDGFRDLQGVEIVNADIISAQAIVSELSGRGYSKLMVEGGGKILRMFLREQCVDYLRFAVAPFFVGDPNAPRFTDCEPFPWNKDNRAILIRTETLGDTAVMWYKLK